MVSRGRPGLPTSSTAISPSVVWRNEKPSRSYLCNFLWITRRVGELTYALRKELYAAVIWERILRQTTINPSCAISRRHPPYSKQGATLTHTHTRTPVWFTQTSSTDRQVIRTEKRNEYFLPWLLKLCQVKCADRVLNPSRHLQQTARGGKAGAV